ncbi:MAG: Lrp/AsnC family transcriptional regulator [Candidatus Bathyarchaeia archaeon]|nr:Lrp/AsnC family transcriptional regulator [Candidatus Bathyarchaeota archaeon A05DMB-4]MDH7594918.1 Lrp/AsnC family transcriptional regulator [Candidatus Bathyarchaeota archaeon]
MAKNVLSGRPLRLLRMLFETGKPVTFYTLHVKQGELAKQLQISRQALNVHLRKLRDLGYIRTGRGFIDVTEEGLELLGVSTNPAFVFLKVSPLKRTEVYEKIIQTQAQRIFRVAGDMDAILVVQSDKLDEALQRLGEIEGIQDTKSYITIQSLK